MVVLYEVIKMANGLLGSREITVADTWTDVYLVPSSCKFTTCNIRIINISSNTSTVDIAISQSLNGAGITNKDYFEYQ